MAPLETLHFEPLGDAVLARVSGEVDLSNAVSVQEQLLDAVPNTATALVLDLSGTGYLDSSGIRLILELAERLSNHGQRLELVVPDHSAVKRVLVLTEIHRVVPMTSSLDELLSG